ncbi:MAG: nucleotide exchange factor GrpE [Patescibacteria group bacterium]|jgi:molecular chaperone GrpE
MDNTTNNNPEPIVVEDALNTPSNDDVTLASQAAEYLAGWQRARADYQNLKRLNDERFLTVNREVKRSLLRDAVPVFDVLGQAHKQFSSGDNSAWLEGVKQILASWGEVCKKWNVTVVPTIGTEFDPRIHESVGADPHTVSGRVAAEVQGGYLVDGELISPAKVIVGTAPPDSP